MSNLEPVEIDGITGEVHDIPHVKNKRYRCELDTVSDVKREMAKVYRECRSNMIDVQTGAKFTWMLAQLKQTIVDNELEQRVEALENVSTKK
jgi:hypothetical protein